jgi:hypothetical protein
MEKTQIICHPIVTQINEFKSIWEEDKSTNKGEALKSFSFIYLFCNYQSPYVLAYNDDKERRQLIESDLSYKYDKKIDRAIAKYKELQEKSCPSLAFLTAARKAANELKNFFSTVNLHSKTATGGAVYKPKDVTGAIGESIKVIEALDKWEERVKKEMNLSDSTIRGGGQEGIFEDEESAIWLKKK